MRQIYIKRLFSKKQVVQNQTMNLQESQRLLGRSAINSLKVGFVGMANIGKSSSFNLLSKQSVPAENFPFCTIDPNQAILQVPDYRFQKLCSIHNPEKQSPATLQITDIAGLVKGASEGHGLGQIFFIKAVDGIYHVVRCFQNQKILHTEGEFNPIRDIQIINNELIQKDIQHIDKLINQQENKAKRSQNLEIKEQFEVLLQVQKVLKDNQMVRNKLWSLKQIEHLNKLQILTSKPQLLLLNLSSQDYIKYKQDQKLDIIDQIKTQTQFQMVPYSVEYMQNNESQEEINSIIHKGFDMLNLMYYFTVGKDEVRSWTIKKNIKAPQAASVIHTDFEKGFISAEVLDYDNYIKIVEEKGLAGLKNKFKKEGKEYIVKNGDIITFQCKIK